MPDVTCWLYKPHGHKHAPLTRETCAYAVADGGRLVTFHQCTRRPTETIDGYGFCRQHAAMVRQRLHRY